VECEEEERNGEKEDLLILSIPELQRRFLTTIDPGLSTFAVGEPAVSV